MRDEISLDDKKTVTTATLMKILDCGKSTALQIGNNAGAKVCVGRKFLWNTKLIQNYIDSISK